MSMYLTKVSRLKIEAWSGLLKAFFPTKTCCCLKFCWAVRNSMESANHNSQFTCGWLYLTVFFRQTWKSLPDTHEIVKEFPNAVINSVDAILDKLSTSNMFFIAKRRNANQEVIYLSAKMPRNVPFLIELTTTVTVPGVKCAMKTPNPELAPLFFEVMELFL